MRSLENIPEWYSSYHQHLILSLEYACKDRIAKVQLAANEAIKYFEKNDSNNDEVDNSESNKTSFKMNKLNLLRNLSKINKDRSDNFSNKDLRDEIYTKGIDSLLKTANFLRSRDDSTIKLMNKNKHRLKLRNNSYTANKIIRNQSKKYFNGNFNKDIDVLYKEKRNSQRFYSNNDEDVILTQNEVNKENKMFVQENIEADNLEIEINNNSFQKDVSEIEKILPLKLQGEKEREASKDKFPMFQDAGNKATELIDDKNNMNKYISEIEVDKTESNQKNQEGKLKNLEINYSASFSYLISKSNLEDLDKSYTNKNEKSGLIINKTSKNIQSRRVVEFSILQENNFQHLKNQIQFLLFSNLDKILTEYDKNIHTKINKINSELEITNKELLNYIIKRNKPQPLQEEDSLNLSEINIKNFPHKEEVKKEKEKLKSSFSNSKFLKNLYENDENYLTEYPIINEWINILKLLESNNKTKAYEDALKSEDDIILLRLLFLSGPCLHELDKLTSVNLIDRIIKISRCNMFQNCFFRFIKTFVDCNLFNEINDESKNEILETLFEFSLYKNHEFGRQSANLYNYILDHHSQYQYMN